MRDTVTALTLALAMTAWLPCGAARAGTATALSANGLLDTNPPQLTPLEPIPGAVLYGGETRTLRWALEELNLPTGEAPLELTLLIDAIPVLVDSLELIPGGNGEYSYDLFVPSEPTLDCRWRLTLADSYGNLGAGEGGPHPIVTEDSPADFLPPAVLTLDQNWPNPFNPSTRLRFGLPRAGAVRLSVHDVQGRQVALLYQGEAEAGWFTVEWRPTHLASGVYFARLSQGELRLTRKLLLLK